MKIFYVNHDFKYEMDNICRLFLSNDKLRDESEDTVYTEKMEGKVLARVLLGAKASEKEFEVVGDEKEYERVMAVALYSAFVEVVGKKSPWGILTGIRPVKLMRSIVKKNGFDYAINYFNEKFLVSDQKTDLCAETMLNENELLNLSSSDSFSLYVSIPFCPTRCSYCSFVSHSIEKTSKLIPSYVDLLCEELRYTGSIVKDLGLKLETIYIGGGTPTTLSADQLDKILTTINKNFSIDTCREFTVEAGRPDTITREKLSRLKMAGVDRISINPQTMHDETLKVIGRAHNVDQTLDAFKLANEFNFKSINVDLIAGLPGEDLGKFKETLSKIIDLGPDNITVHTLAMKRSSYLNKLKDKCNYPAADIVDEMLRFSRSRLTQEGFIPYYLYRQSNMIGNLENVGWSTKGKECLYNVYIMDETHSIIACGAGAVSKIKFAQGDKIERVFNFKYPYEYKDRFDQVLLRKDQAKNIYIDLRDKFLSNTKNVY